MATHPGQDGLVRAVDVAVPRVVKPLPASGDKTSYASKLKTEISTYRRPITKITQLLPEDANNNDVSLHLS